MTEETIHDLVMRSIESQDAKDRAVSALAEFLYTRFYQFRLNCRDEDLRGDYLVWLYPRLAGIIVKFNPEKASLGTYLNWVIRLSFRTFMRNRYSAEAREHACETEETTRLLALETETELDRYDGFLVSDAARAYDRRDTRRDTRRLSDKKREILSRKLLLLACKSGNFIDDAQIERVARLSGYDEAYIREKIELVRKAGEKSRARAKRNVERQNGYYIRARKCLIEMKYVEPGSPRLETLEKEYRFCRMRWHTLRSGKRTRIRSPSNRFLAVTLGISRGTIDSTLAQAMKDGYAEAP